LSPPLPPPPLGTTPKFVCASSSSSSCRRFPPPSPQSRTSTAPIARRPQIGRWRRDVLLTFTAIPRSPAIGPVVQRRCTASRRRRRRRHNPRRQPLTAWNRRCPARRKPLCARRRQGRSPERREGQRGGSHVE
jgi:hypothetical protein